MPIPNFQQQSNQALQSGLRLGGAFQNAQTLQEQRAFNEKMNPLKIQNAQLQGQNLRSQATQQEAINPIIQEQKQLQVESMKNANTKAELTQIAVMLNTYDEEDGKKLIPQLIEQYKDNPIIIKSLEAAYSKTGSEYIQQNMIALSNLTGRPIGGGGKKRNLSDPEKNFETMSSLEDTVEKARASGDTDLLEGATKKLENFRRLTAKFGATAQEKQDIKTAGVSDKSNVQRRQGYIDSGVDAADSYGILRDSVELLKTVKTGGFDQAALKAKQLFGIESADEAQLSANMGKAVLAQLKPIFGSAFTEGEGKRLTDIEAGFGKSTEGNIRLLKETMKIADRSMRRALKAAEVEGDQFVIDEIKTIMAQFEEAKPEEVTTTPSKYTEGVTATGSGGVKMKFTNGQWVKI